MSKAINLVTTKAVTVPVHFNRSTPPSVDEWLKQSLEVFDANLEGAEKAYKLWPTTKARHTNHCSESTETALQALRASMILHRYALSTAKESAIKGITTLDQADETATEAVKAWEKACDSNEVNEAVAQLSAIIAKIEQIPSEKDETPQPEGELVQEWLTQTESPIMKGERASDQSGANSTKSSEHCSKVFQDDDLESQVQGNRRCSTTDEEEIRIIELSDAMHEQRELEKDLERRQTSLQVNAQKRAELSKKMVEHLNEMKEVDTLLRQTMVSQVADSQALRQIRRETDEKQMKIAEMAAATSDIRQRNQLLNGQTEKVYESQHQNAPIITSPEGVQEQHILTLTNALLELTEKVESLKRATEHPKSEWEHTPAPRHDPLYTIRTMDKETTWKSEMGKGEFSEDYERALKNDKRYHSERQEPARYDNKTPVPLLTRCYPFSFSECAKVSKFRGHPDTYQSFINKFSRMVDKNDQFDYDAKMQLLEGLVADRAASCIITNGDDSEVCYRKSLQLLDQAYGQQGGKSQVLRKRLEKLPFNHFSPDEMAQDLAAIEACLENMRVKKIDVDEHGVLAILQDKFPQDLWEKVSDARGEAEARDNAWTATKTLTLARSHVQKLQRRENFESHARSTNINKHHQLCVADLTSNTSRVAAEKQTEVKNRPDKSKAPDGEEWSKHMLALTNAIQSIHLAIQAPRTASYEASPRNPRFPNQRGTDKRFQERAGNAPNAYARRFERSAPNRDSIPFDNIRAQRTVTAPVSWELGNGYSKDKLWMGLPSRALSNKRCYMCKAVGHRIMQCTIPYMKVRETLAKENRCIGCTQHHPNEICPSEFLCIFCNGRHTSAGCEKKEYFQQPQNFPSDCFAWKPRYTPNRETGIRNEQNHIFRARDRYGHQQ